jgi:polygalacturonase
MNSTFAVKLLRGGWLALGSLAWGAVGQTAPAFYNVRDFGAKGDGANLDSTGINAAIDAATSHGGGTIYVPAGTYRSASIRLKSNVSLYLDSGAVIEAAERGNGAEYDAPEANPSKRYQDFGHTFFQNSLLWGIGLKNVTISGPGEIYGKGLVRDSSKTPTDGNKSIALRECQNVTIRDVTIRHGGWFGILTTGVDHLTIDNLKIDTNRDGMDVDCCRDVHISNCTVNSPHDDGICLKSSFALGYARPTEDVSITNCHVSGFEEGSVLDGTYKRKGGATGRIKFGTESNGGFKNIAISNCVFDHCCGFALETVDGGDLEDVVISNITMRDIVNAPIFLRIGRRMRGPAGAPIGKLRRVSISNVRIEGAKESSIIAGIPGHPIEDVSLSGIRVLSDGGADSAQADTVPKEDETGYPEPGALGKMPGHGFYVRHAANIEFRDVELMTSRPDGRPPVVADDVDGIDFFLMKSSSSGAFAKLTNARNVRTTFVDGVPNGTHPAIDKGSL